MRIHNIKEILEESYYRVGLNIKIMYFLNIWYFAKCSDEMISLNIKIIKYISNEKANRRIIHKYKLKIVNFKNR